LPYPTIEGVGIKMSRWCEVMSVEADYKELRGEIQNVSKDLSEKMYSISMQMSTLVGKFDVLASMKTDLDQARDTAKEAFSQARSSHRRLDEVVTDLKPLGDANVVNRLKNIESTIKTLAITVVSAMVTGAIGLLFFYVRGM
jgi:outer membrane murein-binding lipoprotein Lpp